MLQKLLSRLAEARDKGKELLKSKNARLLLLAISLIFFYTAGIIAQFINNRYNWSPGQALNFPSLNPLNGFAMLFTPFGVQAITGLFLVAAIIALMAWMNMEDRTGMIYDKERKFWYSKKGVYGTANWMDDKELKAAFDVTPEEDVRDIGELIYGGKDGSLVSRRLDCMLNRHVAVMGSSGSMKSRTISRATLFAAVRQGHSVVCSDPKVGATRSQLKRLSVEPKISRLKGTA